MEKMYKRSKENHYINFNTTVGNFPIIVKQLALFHGAMEELYVSKNWCNLFCIQNDV